MRVIIGISEVIVGILLFIGVKKWAGKHPIQHKAGWGIGIFLILLLHMESSKVVYLLLWVISLFLISAYLVTVAYIDDQMQKKLKQLGLDLKEGHDYLVQDLPSRLNNNLQSIITAAKEIKL